MLCMYVHTVHPTVHQVHNSHTVAVIEIDALGFRLIFLKLDTQTVVYDME